MLKRRMIIALFTLMVLSAAFSVFVLSQAEGQEETIECASSDEERTTLYNSAHLEAIFGIAPSCENGMIQISTTVSEGRRARKRDIGYLYGNIETREDSKKIVINDGGFIAGSPLKVNISGAMIILDASEPARLYFDIVDGIYLENYYFFACEEEDCRMKAEIMPEEAYLNITGEAVMIYSAVLGKYLRGEPLHKNEQIAKNLKMPLSNLFRIRVEDTSWITITAETSGKGRFGSLQASSEERIKLRRYFSSELNPAGDVAGYIDIVFSKDADVFADEGANFGALSRAELDDAESVRLHANNQQLMELKQGAALVFSDEGLYEQCATGGAGELNLDKGVCGYISSMAGKIRLKPWRTEINAREAPFSMLLSVPPGIRYLEIKEFERDDELSAIIVEKQGLAGKSMLFSRDKFILSENTNWDDFGLSFSAYLYNTESRDFERLECFYERRACYLEQEQVFGFTEITASPAIRCRRDSDCPNEKACRERQCIRPVQCKPVELYGTLAQEPLDVVFVSDAYDNEREFLSDVTAAIKGDAMGHIGLLTVEPFKSNAHKFKFQTIYTGDRVPETEYVSWLGREMPSERYVRKLKEKCPAADRAIVLSKRNFRSFADVGGDTFVSSTEKPAWTTATFVHEFGHSFGYLKDEYYEPGEEGYVGRPNCLDKGQAKSFWGEGLANEAIAGNWLGCGGAGKSEYASYLKPSFNSIMNDQTQPGGDVFNTPSIEWLQDLLDEYI